MRKIKKVQVLYRVKQGKDTFFWGLGVVETEVDGKSTMVDREYDYSTQ